MFLAGTGLFTWTPTYQQAGTYTPTFIASDGQSAQTLQVPITVSDVNTAPSITLISPAAIETNFGYLNVSTSTNASCRYGTSDASFDSLTPFEKSTGFVHAQLLTSLSGSTTFYIKCRGQGLDTSSMQRTITVSEAPSADISLDPRSPNRPGLIAVTVQVSSALQATPSLH